MNVILMLHEIGNISNAMVGESALPDFGVAADNCSEFVRVGALDELHGAFECYVLRWR